MTGLGNRAVRARGVSRTGASAALCALAMAALTPLASAAVGDTPFFRADKIVIVFGASDYLESGGVAPYIGDFLLLRDASAPGTDLIAGDLRPINYNTSRFNPINNPDSAGIEYTVRDPQSGGQFISGPPHQTLGAGDAFTSFTLNADTSIELRNRGNRASRFFVASNAAFDIFAEADDLQATGAFAAYDLSSIRFRFRVDTRGGNGANRWGTAAQHPGGAADPDDETAGILLGRSNGPRNSLADIAGGPTQVFDGAQRTAASRGSILQQAAGFQARYNLQTPGSNPRDYDFSMGTGSIGARVTYTVYSP